MDRHKVLRNHIAGPFSDIFSSQFLNFLLKLHFLNGNAVKEPDYKFIRNLSIQ